MITKVDVLTDYKKYINRIVPTIKNRNEGQVITIEDIILVIIGFVLSRGVVMHYLTPFYYSFLTYLIKNKNEKKWIAISVFLGLLTVHDFTYVIRAGFTYLALTVIISQITLNPKHKLLIALSSSISVLVIGSVFQLFVYSYFFDYVLIIFEAILTFLLFHIYEISLPILLNSTKRSIYSNEEIICSTILISLLILGIGQATVYNINLSIVAAIFILLLFGYKLGIGASSSLGIVLGLVVSIGQKFNPVLIGTYGFCGLLAGTFNKLGKIASIVGFIIGNALLTFYINGSTEVIIQIEEILIASVLLLLTPKSLLEKIHIFDTKEYSIKDDQFYKDGLNHTIKSNLKGYALVFKEMAKSFNQKNQASKDHEFNNVCQRVASEICSKCSLSNRCWKTDRQNTINTFMELLTTLKEKSYLDEEDIPQKLSNKCIKAIEVIKVMNYLFETYKNTKILKDKIEDDKIMISQQLFNTAAIIDDISCHLEDELFFKIEEERDIRVELDREGIHIEKIIVAQEISGRYRIFITSSKCLTDKVCRKRMPEIMSRALNKKIILDNRICLYNGDQNDKCRITYQEAAPYRITTGIVRCPKEKKEVSGDQYSDLVMSNGKHLLALCDGMGTGNKASLESITAVNLLEQFLQAGLDKEIAIRTINSILILRSEEEVFSTLDFMLFDKFTGKAQFNKIGAACTFVKKGVEIKAIHSKSLPAGILEEIKMESCEIQLVDGDYIIMFTDGLLACNPDSNQGEEWIMQLLNDTTSRNPQKIAENLVDNALKKCKNKPKDDITVLIGRVWGNSTAH